MAKIKQVSAEHYRRCLLTSRRRTTRAARSEAEAESSAMAQSRRPEDHRPLRRSARVRRRSPSLSEEMSASTHTSTDDQQEQDNDQEQCLSQKENEKQGDTTSLQLTVHEGTQQLRNTSTSTNQSQSQFVFDWVRNNYQYEPDHNVPRSGMYEHYVAACAQADNGIQPVNSATFGKLIRHVFTGISTRRLGTRGQSRYHYCGLRRRTVPLSEDDQPVESEAPMVQAPPQRLSKRNTSEIGRSRGPHRARRSLAIPTVARYVPVDMVASYNPDDAFDGYRGHDPLYQDTIGSSSQLAYAVPIQSQWHWRTDYAPYAPRPDQTVPVQLPEFSAKLPDTLRENDVALGFAYAYEKHCFDILECIRTFQFNNIFSSMVKFYHTLPDAFRALIHDEPYMTEAIWRWDCWLYDVIILTALPTIYVPLNHTTLIGLLQLTREFDQYIAAALQKNYPLELCQRKMRVAQVFVSKFRRNLKLNQMAQVASTLLHQKSNFDAMIKDWNNIDFLSVLDQAFWVCECDSDEVGRLFQEDILNLLRTKAGLPQWVSWIKAIVDKYIHNIQRQPLSQDDPGYCLFHVRQLMFKWNYFGSLVMKNLSFSHAASTGEKLEAAQLRAENMMFNYQAATEIFRALKSFFDDLALFFMEKQIAETGRTQGSSSVHMVNTTDGGSQAMKANASGRDVLFETPPPSVTTSVTNSTNQSSNTLPHISEDASTENDNAVSRRQ